MVPSWLPGKSMGLWTSADRKQGNGISSKAHQQKAPISTGRCTSLQRLTYYHNVVARKLACAAVPANCRAPGSRPETLQLLRGIELDSVLKVNFFVHSNAIRYPPSGPAERPIRGSWRGRLIVLSSPADPQPPH